jgi:hypothetical protein
MAEETKAFGIGEQDGTRGINDQDSHDGGRLPPPLQTLRLNGYLR